MPRKQLAPKPITWPGVTGNALDRLEVRTSLPLSSALHISTTMTMMMIMMVSFNNNNNNNNEVY